MDILNYRVQQVGKLNVQIADWLLVSGMRLRGAWGMVTDGEVRNGGGWRNSIQRVCANWRRGNWMMEILGRAADEQYTKLKVCAYEE